MRYTTRPLSGWDGPRTPSSDRRSRWTFKASWSNTLALLERELGHLDATDVVLEADFREQDLRLDGMPRSNARPPVDPAVRISFASKYGPLIYQADSCEQWQHNVRSIALGLEALRAVDRYGITRRAQQYSGWRQIGAGPSAALVPEPPMDRPRAASILIAAAYSDAAGYDAMHPLWERELLAGVGPHSVNVVTRRALRFTHPDAGGTSEAFDQVQRAITVLGGGAS